MFGIVIFYSSIILASDTTNINFYKKITPNCLKVQFAGNIGFLSTGVGYEYLNSHLQSYVLFGYVPEKFANKEILSISQKNTYSIISKRKLTPTISITTNFDLNNNTFYKAPDIYPEDYYSTKAIKIIFDFGIKYRYLPKNKSCFKAYEIYADASSTDINFIMYYDSKFSILKDIFSLSLGVNILLD